MRTKIIALSIAIALLCISAISATLAYFQDTEYDRNVMTVGNVNIAQNEYQRDEDGNIVDFVQDKGLSPVTGLEEDDIVYDGVTYDAFNTDKNVLDKIVTVTNTGKLDAYVRTVFAFEMKPVNGQWVNPIGNDLMAVDSDLGTMEWTDVTFELGGIMYVVGVYYYANDSILTAGDESHASLLQVYLGSHVGNEWYEAVGDEYEILAVSQAVQVSGFDDAEVALTEAFGDVNLANCANWFAPQA